ncbi:hypothetical protein O181_010102 [Austropuccinia psidii MF-1]|uniref:Uncharacterized protein n=1 Tax=Austropuccinia psidii MF-1 TaxID=1389203 RepID=A0A9Q3BT27_9BASI|nr:hypothetical protein [Austropuccinia psidii MF-1]
MTNLFNMMYLLDLAKPLASSTQSPSIIILNTTPPPDAKLGPSKHPRMALPEDWEPMVKPFGNIKTPQAEVYPGYSKKPQMTSDEDLDPKWRHSLN